MRRMLAAVTSCALAALFTAAAIAGAPAPKPVEVIAPADVRLADSDEIYALASTPDGKQLITAGRERYADAAKQRLLNAGLKLWDLESGKLLQAWPMAAPYQAACADCGTRLQWLRLLPDGGSLVAYNEQRFIELLAVPSGRSLAALPSGKPYFRHAALSRDGARLALGDIDGNVAVWSLPERRELFAWKTHEWTNDPKKRVSMGALEFSADAGTLLTGHNDGTVQAWALPSLKKGKALKDLGKIKSESFEEGELLSDGTVRLTGRMSPTSRKVVLEGVEALELSPDGGTLAIGTFRTRGGGGVVLWSLAQKKVLADLSCFALIGGSKEIAFSADGRWLARNCSVVGSDKHGITVQDVIELVALPEARVVARLHAGKNVSALGFTPDSTRLVSANRSTGRVRGLEQNNQTVVVWGVEPPRFVAYLSDPAARP